MSWKFLINVLTAKTPFRWQEEDGQNKQAIIVRQRLRLVFLTVLLLCKLVSISFVPCVRMFVYNKPHFFLNSLETRGFCTASIHIYGLLGVVKVREG